MILVFGSHNQFINLLEFFLVREFNNNFKNLNDCCWYDWVMDLIANCDKIAKTVTNNIPKTEKVAFIMVYHYLGIFRPSSACARGGCP